MKALPGTLCHYTTSDVAFEHILPSRQLRLSPYARMRDPLENRELTFSSAEPAADHDGDERRLRDMAWFIQRVRNETALLSLTTDAQRGYSSKHEPFMRAWARAPLWEQYAENHAGVCIVFDQARVLEDISTALAAREGVTAAAEVKYLPRGFADTTTSQIDLSTFNPYDLPGLAQFVIDHQKDLFFVKALDWQSEHEFRIIHSAREPADGGYVHVPFDAGSIRAVIVGERFPTWQLSAAQTVCAQAGVQLLKVQWRSGLPQPTPVEL